MELELLKATVFYLQGRFQEAIACLEHASSVVPYDVELYAALSPYHLIIQAKER